MEVFTCRSRTESSNKGSGSYHRKTGNLSNCLVRKKETRSDLLKGNQSRARIYLTDLKGREAGEGEQKQGACKLQQSPGSGDREMKKFDSNAEQPALARA